MTSTFDIAAISGGINFVPSSVDLSVPPATGLSRQGQTEEEKDAITVDNFRTPIITLEAEDTQKFPIPTFDEFEKALGPNVFRKGLIIAQRFSNPATGTTLDTKKANGYSTDTAFDLANAKNQTLYFKVTQMKDYGDDNNEITITTVPDLV